MARTFIAYLLCAVLALVGVAGAHVHGHSHWGLDHESHARVSDADDDHDIHVVTDADAAHLSDHDRHGAHDIDVQVKAFGKHTVAAPLLILALFCAFFAVVVDGRARVGNFPPPLRPPRARSRFFFTPPSHAPPSLLA